VYVFDGPHPGPTALIQAGIHGDEVAGVHALQELLEAGIRPTHGRLIVVPVMNPSAYRARQRTAPDGLDLNRCFPGERTSDRTEVRLARRFMDLVLAEQPILVATLHESHKRYDPALVPSFGQSIVYGVEPAPEIVGRLVAGLNERFPEPEHEFAPQFYPVATSSTEVIVDAIGCIGLCIETWMALPEPLRIRMHKTVVELMLADVGVRVESAPTA
jgi:hypothetical protein